MTDPADRPFKERADAVIRFVWGGEHHVDTIKWTITRDGGLSSSRCEFKIFGELSTFDFSEMTRLVVAAHDHCVRAAVWACGRQKLRVLLSDRRRTAPDHQDLFTHPTLEDHVACLRKTIDRSELFRRLGASPPTKAP
jgi:hypothetical protein